jgi:hypothetical protein
VAEYYRVAVGLWSIQPSEFWDMSPQEWWWVYDARVGEPKYGKMTLTEVEELYHMLEDYEDGRNWRT